MTPQHCDISKRDTSLEATDFAMGLLFLPSGGIAGAGIQLGAWEDGDTDDETDDEATDSTDKLHPQHCITSDGNRCRDDVSDRTTSDPTATDENDSTKYADEERTSLNDSKTRLPGDSYLVETSLTSEECSPKRVHFSPSVRVVRFLKASPEDWSHLYYSGHELQKLMDDYELERMGAAGISGMAYLSPF